MDAVVNTVSSDLRNFGSVAKALLNASGLEMEVEKQRHRCKMYDVGEVGCLSNALLLFALLLLQC